MADDYSQFTPADDYSSFKPVKSAELSSAQGQAQPRSPAPQIDIQQELKKRFSVPKETVDIKQELAQTLKKQSTKKKVLIPKSPKPSFLDPLIPKMDSGEPIPHPLRTLAPDLVKRMENDPEPTRRAVGKMILSLTEVPNLMAMASGPAAIPAMGVMGGAGLFQGAGEIEKAIKAGDSDAAIEAATSLGLNAGMMALPLIHGMTRGSSRVGLKDLIKGESNAVQERGPETLLQRQPGETGATGSGRGRVQPRIQGEAPTGESIPPGGAEGIDNQNATPQAGAVGPHGETGLKLQSTVIPGAEEFVTQDVEPAIQTLKEAPEKIKGALTEMFNPPGVAKSAEVTAQYLRARSGEMARSEEQARSTLQKTRNYFSKTLIRAGGAPKSGDVLATDHPALQFVRSVEAGEKLPPEMQGLQPMADWMRETLDKTWQKVRDLGIADGFIDDYWPHLWQKPGRVSNYLRQITGKRPFAGPETFKRQRIIPTFDQGLQAGLEPVTWNPVEQFMLKLHEMNRSIVAHSTWKFLKDEGIPQLVKGRAALASHPPMEGYEWVDDKIARAIEIRPTTKVSGEPGSSEIVLHGRYALPTPAARILNNYLSPGLRGKYIYDAMQGIGNTLNQAQLGLSAFHLAFVGHDAAVSHTALGIQNILEGRVKSGLKNVALGVSQTAIPKSLVRGAKIAKAYRAPMIDPNTPMGRTVGLLEKAGARINQAPEYINKSVDSLRNALERHNYPGAALRLVPAMFEVAAKPVMEYAVPRLKLGVAEAMLNSEVERLGPNASEADLTAAAQKVWDSVDNRMGQLVYDNLFWNNYLKQGGQLAQRSLGWNLGSVRELGGGVKDVATAPFRVKSGDRLITHRIAYGAALPLQTALAGSILYYLYNGKPAPTMKDALQPKVGKERWQIASYMRDVIPFVSASKEGLPGIAQETKKRVISKLNPEFSAIGEFLSNEDYWGNPIYGDSKKAIGATNWLINQFTPFSFRNPGRKATRAEKTRQFFGFTRVPKERNLKEQERSEGMRLLKAASKK